MSKRTIIILVIAVLAIAVGVFSLWSEKQKEIKDLLNVSEESEPESNLPGYPGQESDSYMVNKPEEIITQPEADSPDVS